MMFQPPPCAVLPVLRMNYSVASTEAKPVRISKNLSFRPAYDSHLSQQERPLVLVYGWLVAKAKHIHKYGDFYLKKGFDVLHIKVTPSQLLRPTLAQGVIKQAVGFTKEAKHRQQPLLIHGFSVGGYLFGETLVQMRENKELKQHFGDRIQGQIMDSPVDFHGIPYGVSQAVTQIPVVQRSMQASLEMYLKVFQNQTKAYLRSSETFRANEFGTPTLFLYSQADKVGPAERIEEVNNIRLIIKLIYQYEKLKLTAIMLACVGLLLSCQSCNCATTMMGVTDHHRDQIEFIIINKIILLRSKIKVINKKEGFTNGVKKLHFYRICFSYTSMLF